MRILLTGASGLLGACLAHHSLQAGFDVVSGYGSHLPPFGKPLRFDLTKLDQIDSLVTKANPDVIVHTAGLTDVDLCEEKPDLALLINGEATGKIGQAARRLGIPVVYISTDYVFNGTKGLYSEEESVDPVNVYGRSKLLGERLLKESGSKYCIARTSVIYGWGRRHRANFGTWILDKLRSHQAAKVVKDQYASPTFNRDLAEMILDVIANGIDGTIHLAGVARIDRYHFALRIADTFELNRNLIKAVRSDEVSWKAKRPRDSSLKVQRAEMLLDRKPVELDEALERFRREERL